MTASRSALVRAHISSHPFTFCLAIAATASAIVLAVDEQAFTTISILQVTNTAMGVAWLVACAAAGVITLAGIVVSRADVEGLGLMLLSATCAVQGVGTLARFGTRSVFPILLFFACAAACLWRVLQIARARRPPAAVE